MTDDSYEELQWLRRVFKAARDYRWAVLRGSAASIALGLRLDRELEGPAAQERREREDARKLHRDATMALTTRSRP